MKRLLLLFTILLMSVVTSACINNFAVQELNSKAESYMSKGDTEAAICRLKSSLDLDNNVYQTHYNLGVAYTGAGDYDNAVKELEKTKELNPEYAYTYYALAAAKEALAYQALEKDAAGNKKKIEPSAKAIKEFNAKAGEAVEIYNEYLVKKPNADEADKVNKKISELNQKIKEYTEIYDRAQSAEENQIQNGVYSGDEEQAAIEEYVSEE